MTSIDPIYVDDRTAAKMIDLSYEMFRRCWERLVKEDGFPKPWHPPKARGQDGERSKIRHWNALAIQRWSERDLPPELRTQPRETADRAKLDARLDRIEREART